MLFLFRGHHGPLVRVAVGAALLLAGVAVDGGMLIAAIGAMLILWGVSAELGARSRRRHLGSSEQAS